MTPATLLTLDQTKITTPQQARVLVRQAKKLGRCDLLPGWLLSLAKCQNPAVTSEDTAKRVAGPRNAAPAVISDRERCIAAKSDEHSIPTHVLRTVFQRGLREYTQMSTEQRLPVCAEQVANARVNTFVRLVYGDPTARDCDSDLLALVPDLPRR